MKANRGWSLIELMIAMTITLGIGMIAFQLFQQNERVFRDQNQILEMQQTARAVATQIADEIRMAGQGVPVYSATFDTVPQEAVQFLLSGSNATTIRFRADSRNVYTTVNSPTAYTIGSTANAAVQDAQVFAATVGATPSPGTFAYLWGPTANGWGWVRVELGAITTATNTMSVTPRQSGTTGLTFAGKQTLSLEEGVAFRLDGERTVRAVVTNFTNLTTPTWQESELGRNIATLNFTYSDASGYAVDVSTLAGRASVRRVDVRLVARTSTNLSNGTRPSHSINLQTYLRNAPVF